MAGFRKKIYLLLLSLSLLIFIVACTKGPDVPFPAFDFSLEDVFTGEDIHLAELKGKPVLLYYFASW
jgi:hypothetical protein